MNKLDRLHDESHVREYSAGEWRRMLEMSGFSVALAEPYFKHLPLTSLTTNVSRENTEKIQAIVEGLNNRQWKAMNGREIDGVIHLNHWYVMICASLRRKSRHRIGNRV